MADEPKPQPADAPKPAEGASTSTSPAPTDVTDAAKPTPDPNQKIQPEPLSDGTTPTVLVPGESHQKVAKGKTSLTTIYRKADILTTLVTFIGAVVAGGLIIGGYAYFTRSKTPTAPAPKVTTLDKGELDKLTAFFGGNSAGSSAEVLTISSSSLFKNRVGISSDLKVVGGVQVSGTTALGDLTVDKVSTLGVTNIRGSLTVAGPANIQSPAILGAGATINGNLAVTGNGSFGGSVSAGTLNVRDLSVSGTLNLNGHINVGGQNPSAAPASSLVTSASVAGSDASGTVTINAAPTSGAGLGGALVTVTFRSTYPRAPVVVISPGTRGSALYQPYVLKTATNFTIMAAVVPANGSATSNSFDYWVVQ
jgi:hypothetical protein